VRPTSQSWRACPWTKYTEVQNETPAEGLWGSLTEAPAPSLFHVEVKMTLVGLIGARPQHRAKDPAGVVAHGFQECSFGFI
jgi:hypothetical protein